MVRQFTWRLVAIADCNRGACHFSGVASFLTPSGLLPVRQSPGMNPLADRVADFSKADWGPTSLRGCPGHNFRLARYPAKDAELDSTAFLDTSD